MVNRRLAPVVSLVVALGLALLSSDAAAQSAAPISSPGGQSSPLSLRWPVLVGLERQSLAPGALTIEAQPAPQRRPPHDSLKNGAIIGAVVGAGALGALGAFYCNLYQEEGGPSCRSDTLRAAAIGAAIGTGTGLVLDAAFERHAGVTVRMRVRF
ncbi:MAG TPA: hypothetical protein VFO58_05835 [Vicinamibacterales bacterium]|nr:hypothetical protein [Vicinamibacterales bacterium]